MNDNKIRYYYFGRTEKGNTNGIITCATELVGSTIKVGFSFCSPKDTFKKHLGRKIALGRMMTEPVVLDFHGHSGDDVSHYINHLIEREKSNRGTLRQMGWPAWVKRVKLDYGINSGFVKNKMSSNNLRMSRM